MKLIKRGDIIYLDLGQHARSSVQSGIRPCLVVSNDRSNRYSKVLNVCPFSVKEKVNPVHVYIKREDVSGYFQQDSYCMLEQITTIDKRKIISKVGSIKSDSEAMKIIDERLLLQFGLLMDTEMEVNNAASGE